MNIKLSQTQESFTNNEGKISKNNTVSWIFFIIVGITEFIIIVIQKEQKNPQINAVEKEARIMVDTVTYLLIRHQDRPFDINDFKYSPFISSIESWDAVKKLYNLLPEIGVASMSGTVCRLNENPISTIKQYYSTLKSLY